MRRELPPWMFHFTDKAVADAVAPFLYEQGAVVVADPAHLPEQMRTDYLHTVSGVVPDADGAGEHLDLFIHAVEWTRDIEWIADEPDHVASVLFGWAESPVEFFGGADDVDVTGPERARILDWLGLDEDDE